MSRNGGRTEWVAWAGLALTSFAILEHQGIRRSNGRRTLSHHVKGVAQHSQASQAATVIGIAGFASWLAYHFAFEPRED